MNLENMIFTIPDAAEMIGVGKNKLYAFLRKHGILEGRKVNPHYVALGYFVGTCYEIDVRKDYLNLPIRITEEGLVMISELAKLLKPAEL